MTRLLAFTFAAFTATAAWSQELIDKGFVEGWNIMMDPALGNGCLIQTIYQDLSVVRLGYDALGNRGYFTVYNKAWGDIEPGKAIRSGLNWTAKALTRPPSDSTGPMFRARRCFSQIGISSTPLPRTER